MGWFCCFPDNAPTPYICRPAPEEKHVSYLQMHQLAWLSITAVRSRVVYCRNIRKTWLNVLQYFRCCALNDKWTVYLNIYLALIRNYNPSHKLRSSLQTLPLFSTRNSCDVDNLYKKQFIESSRLPINNIRFSFRCIVIIPAQLVVFSLISIIFIRHILLWSSCQRWHWPWKLGCQNANIIQLLRKFESGKWFFVE